jgi:hypothetical protein
LYFLALDADFLSLLVVVPHVSRKQDSRDENQYCEACRQAVV